LGIWLSFGGKPLGLPQPADAGGQGGPAELLDMSGFVREHIAAATAALVQPGGGRAGLWQTAMPNAISPQTQSA